MCNTLIHNLRNITCRVLIVPIHWRFTTNTFHLPYKIVKVTYVHVMFCSETVIWIKTMSRTHANVTWFSQADTLPCTDSAWWCSTSVICLKSVCPNYRTLWLTSQLTLTKATSNPYLFFYCKYLKCCVI